MLVLVDDCHWADPESLRFLHYLAQRLEGLPVAMLLAGRPPDPAGEDGGGLWALVRSRPDAVAVFPQPLTEDAATELTRARLGEEAAAGVLPRRVTRPPVATPCTCASCCGRSRRRGSCPPTGPPRTCSRSAPPPSAGSCCIASRR